MSLPAAGSKALVGVRFARALQLRRRRQRAVLAYRSTALFLDASARDCEFRKQSARKSFFSKECCLAKIASNMYEYMYMYLLGNYRNESFG
jgi:hypothetical protein